MLQLLLNHIWKLLEVIVYTVKNLPRDVAALNTLAHVKKKLSILDKKNQNVPEYFSKWVIEQPNKPCIIYNETTWTFKYVCIKSIKTISNKSLFVLTLKYYLVLYDFIDKMYSY